MAYMCVGKARGWCGHYHRTLRGAIYCRLRDIHACERQGGYSDRLIFTQDQVELNLSDEPIWLGEPKWERSEKW